MRNSCAGAVSCQKLWLKVKDTLLAKASNTKIDIWQNVKQRISSIHKTFFNFGPIINEYHDNDDKDAVTAAHDDDGDSTDPSCQPNFLRAINQSAFYKWQSVKASHS